MLGLKKRNFKTKNIYFEKSHKAEQDETGDMRYFKHPLLQNIKKLKGDSLDTYKKFSNKKNKKENAS